MKTKNCKCGETSPDNFSPANFHKCRICTTKANKKYKANNLEKVQENEKRYRDEHKEKAKQYRIDNKDKLSDYRKQYSLDNKDSIAKNRKEYYENNKDSAKQYSIDNAEAITSRRKQHRLDNIDEYNERKKNYVLKNKDKVNEYQRKYRSENKEQFKEYDKLKNVKEKLGIAEEKMSNGNSGGDWLFYICEFKSEETNFFKYGITRFDVFTRFNRTQYNNYNIEVVMEIFGAEDFIKGLERKILIETINDLYVFPPHISFHGKTECRTKIDLDLVESLTN